MFVDSVEDGDVSFESASLEEGVGFGGGGDDGDSRLGLE